MTNVDTTIQQIERELDLYDTIEAVEPILASFKYTAEKIRYLNSQGMKRADIARTLDIRYQHVKNVLDVPLKKSH